MMPGKRGVFDYLFTRGKVAEKTPVTSLGTWTRNVAFSFANPTLSKSASMSRLNAPMSSLSTSNLV
jgi:hypothetical protein